jgi:hypothetical protein
VWGVNRARNIFTRNGVNGKWVQVDGALEHVTIARDGVVWGVNKEHTVYFRNGEHDVWHPIDGKVTKVSAGNNLLHAIDETGNTWMYDKQNHWKQNTVNFKFDHIANKFSGLLIGHAQDRFYAQSGFGEWRHIPKAPLQIKWIA